MVLTLLITIPFVPCINLKNRKSSPHNFRDTVHLCHLRSIVQKATPLNPPLFIFKRCPNAAAHNAKILEEHNFQLDSIIKTQHPSQISYGSEFRSSIDLEELLRDHPLWPKLQDILDNGASFPLEPISDKDRKEDLDFHSTRGNHKSTMKYFDVINNIVTEDIERGFALPLPLSILKNYQMLLLPHWVVKSNLQ